MADLTLVPPPAPVPTLDEATERFLAMNSELGAKYAHYLELFSSIGAIAEERPAWKVQADLVAHGARAGFEVVAMADGSFVVGKWGMIAALADLAAVEAFLRKVGAIA